MARKKATPKQNLYVGLGMLGLCGILALMGSGDDDDKTKTTKPTAAASQPAVIALTDIPATDIPITEKYTVAPERYHKCQLQRNSEILKTELLSSDKRN